jgi:biopolymer transport protein ExbB
LTALTIDVPLILAQAADAAATTAAAAPGGKTLLQYIHSGGVLSYVLVLVSVVAVALIITNLIQLRRDRLAPPVVVGALERLLRDRNVPESIKFCLSEENDSFITRLIGNGLTKAQRMPGGATELRACLEEAGAREVDRLERVTQGIGILAAIGPMLGLLGTVIGMIGAFATIGSANSAGRSDQLAGFMSIALVTTAEGLIVAIPCTVAFALFKRRLDRLVADVADQAERLVLPLLTAVPQPRPVAAAVAAGGAVPQGMPRPPMPVGAAPVPPIAASMPAAPPAGPGRGVTPS